MSTFYLNLSEGYDPCGKHMSKHKLGTDKFTFSGGEKMIKIRMNPLLVGQDVITKVVVSSRLQNSDDFMMLCTAMSALRHNMKVKDIVLIIPYFPGARMDRTMHYGEPFSAKMYAEIVNSWGCSKVIVHDPHSDVTSALVNNIEVVDNHQFIREVRYDILGTDRSISDILYISPDAGSGKKIFGLMRDLDPNGICDIIKCDKHRDTKTGNIEEFEVYANDLDGKDCLIVDDICDGGGTFIGLAQELKKAGAGDLYLAVTHGIFSKGFYGGLAENFKLCYCTDSWDVDDPRFVKVIKQKFI